MIETTHRFPSIVPVFPLPDHVLLPGLAFPYRVFEPRYREMVEHLLALAPPTRWLAIPRLAPGWEADYEGRPPFLPVATVVRLTECKRNADGTFHIVVDDGLRCRLEEAESDRSFRFARADAWPDLPCDEGELRAQHAALLQVIGALAGVLGSGARGLVALAAVRGDIAAGTFRLGSVLLQNPDRRQEFLLERSPLRRIDQLMDAAAVLLSLAGAQQAGGGESLS